LKFEDLKGLISYLNEIETRYPVNNWIIGDTKVWPLIKLIIFKRIFYLTNPTSGYVKKEGKKGNAFLLIFKSMLYLLKISIKFMTINEYVFSGAPSHRVRFNDKLYNRYFDPMIDWIEKELDHKCLHIEYSCNRLSSEFYNKKNIILLNKLIPFFKIKGKLYKRRLDIAFSGFDEFCKEINRKVHFDENIISEQVVRNQYSSILLYKRIFNWLIKKYKVRYTFGLCYYNNPMIGMNLAAFENQIPSIDMQHGSQGPLHVAYANWHEIDHTGYTMLPEYFWCWDDLSAASINQWAGRQKFHKVIVGGNPWNEIWKQQNTQNLFNFDDSKQIVLYTMQPVGDLLDSYLIDTIKLSSPDHVWWLRLHPRQLSAMPELLQIIDDNGLNDKVNVQDATSLPLPLIFSKCHVHISKYSGSINESIQFNVPTIIIDEIGTNTFSKEINRGTATGYTKNDSYGLLRIIESMTTNSNINSSYDRGDQKYKNTFRKYFSA
jgi:hypothetical protein